MEIGNDLPGLKLKTLHVGGLPGEGNHVRKGFVGCIQVSVFVDRTVGALVFFLSFFRNLQHLCAVHQGVRMGETSNNVANVNMAQGLKIRVEDGCDVDDPCDSNICPDNSHCSDDWNSYTCVCDPGDPHVDQHWSLCKTSQRGLGFNSGSGVLLRFLW